MACFALLSRATRSHGSITLRLFAVVCDCILHSCVGSKEKHTDFVTGTPLDDTNTTFVCGQDDSQVLHQIHEFVILKHVVQLDTARVVNFPHDLNLGHQLRPYKHIC